MLQRGQQTGNFPGPGSSSGAARLSRPAGGCPPRQGHRRPPAGPEPPGLAPMPTCAKLWVVPWRCCLLPRAVNVHVEAVELSQDGTGLACHHGTNPSSTAPSEKHPQQMLFAWPSMVPNPSQHSQKATAAPGTPKDMGSVLLVGTRAVLVCWWWCVGVGGLCGRAAGAEHRLASRDAAVLCTCRAGCKTLPRARSNLREMFGVVWDI